MARSLHPGIIAAVTAAVVLLGVVSCSSFGEQTVATRVRTRAPATQSAAPLPLGPEYYTLADLGTTLAYARVDRTGAGTLVLHTPDGQVTDVREARGVFSGIAWAPGGSVLAASFGPSAAQQDIWTVNSDGSGLMRLTNDGLSRRPTWSPDGAQIVFSRSAGAAGQGGLSVVEAQGGTPRPLAPDSAYDFPSWSPDGASLAASRAPGVMAILSPVNGALSREVFWLRGSQPTATSFSWSADGTAITGVVARDGALAIAVLGDDFTTQRQVGAAVLGAPPDPAWVHPAWVLGGTKLLAASAESGAILLFDTAATVTDTPSTAPYAPVQVLLSPPRGTKLAFPAVKPERAAGGGSQFVRAVP